MTSWEEHVAASDTEAPSCICDDPQAHAMAALIESGRGVLEAARLVYTDDPTDARSFIRLGFALAFPWLRLPEEAAA